MQYDDPILDSFPPDQPGKEKESRVSRSLFSLVSCFAVMAFLVLVLLGLVLIVAALG